MHSSDAKRIIQIAFVIPATNFIVVSSRAAYSCSLSTARMLEMMRNLNRSPDIGWLTHKRLLLELPLELLLLLFPFRGTRN